MEAKEEDHLDILEVDHPLVISMEVSLEAVLDHRHLITEAVSAMTEDLLVKIVLDLTI